MQANPNVNSDPNPNAGRRPWLNAAVERRAEADPFAEYRAWESWFYDHFDCELPESEGLLLDAMSVTQKAYLYNLMGRLADGMEPDESLEPTGIEARP